jgi:hypothetical protein
MSENSPLESASPLEDAWFASRMPSRDPPTEKKLHRPVRLRFLPPSCHVGSGDVSNDERGMERPARTKSRSQICRLGGRSLSSDITMPLSLTTACACLAARSSCESASLLEDWRAGSLAQSPPCGVLARAIFRGPLVPGARCVRPGRICGTRFPRDTGPLITRH